jgi:uncharacterized protein DUF3592
VFSFIVESVQAYNQVGFFIGALVCLGVGGLIFGNALYWRVHAVRATGTVIGVIDRGGMYTPVYRYTLPDGQTHEAKSDTSSGWARGKETGRVVSLMISAHKPTEAREANNYLFDAVGILLIVPGVWLGYTALTAYPVTWMTWIMAVVMVFYLVERGRRVFIPKGQRLSIADWKKQYGLGEAPTIDSADIKPIEKIIATPEMQQKLQTQWQNNKRAAPFVGIFAVALLGVGIYQARDLARLESSGLRAQGEVERLVGESSSKGGYSYHAIVRYRTEKNIRVEFKDNVGSNPPSYRPGDKVTVLYLANNPRGQAIIDRGLWWNWAIPGILFLAAALVAWLFMVMLGIGATRKSVSGLATETPA